VRRAALAHALAAANKEQRRPRGSPQSKEKATVHATLDARSHDTQRHRGRGTSTHQLRQWWRRLPKNENSVLHSGQFATDWLGFHTGAYDPVALPPPSVDRRRHRSSSNNTNTVTSIAPSALGYNHCGAYTGIGRGDERRTGRTKLAGNDSSRRRERCVCGWRGGWEGGGGRGRRVDGRYVGHTHSQRSSPTAPPATPLSRSQSAPAAVQSEDWSHTCEHTT
jgi:hypothetical protein